MRSPGFYTTPGDAANAAITAQIQTVFQRHRGFYGAPRVHQELRAAGLKVGRHRVARLMRRAVLKAQTRRGFRPCRDGGSEGAGVAENHRQQDFSPLAPNRCWAGDITSLRTSAGWRYLAVWIDGYYNRGRCHSTIAYLNPIDYRQQYIYRRKLDTVMT